MNLFNYFLLDKEEDLKDKINTNITDFGKKLENQKENAQK
jgi:hypothetical protein